MRRAWVERARSLLEVPAPAVLTTFRRDGGAHTVPVWSVGPTTAITRFG